MNIYITLDYELFMNDITGDVEHCLITPTNALLDILEKHRVKATFFVDAAYLYRLNIVKQQYPVLEKDFDLISHQIKRIVSKEHSIGLHLHPQWFYATFDGNKWVMDFEHYKLSDMPQPYADELFVECCCFLEHLSETKVNSFRAGGYSIQSYKSFPSILSKCNIEHDSSVRYRMRNISKLHSYDYRNVKKSDSYLFSYDLTVENPQGKYTEFPISTIPISYFSYCFNRYKLKKIKENRNWGNGGANPGKKRKNFMINVLKKTRLFVTVPATIDYESFSFCHKVFSKYQSKKNNDFVIIGHPKNFSPASLAYLDKFIEDAQFIHSFKTI